MKTQSPQLQAPAVRTLGFPATVFLARLRPTSVAHWCFLEIRMGRKQGSYQLKEPCFVAGRLHDP